MKLAPSILIKPIIQSDNKSTDTPLYTELKNSNLLTDLYHKCEHEPDFDCEFLNVAHDHSENENTIDSEFEDDFLDEFNDNIWDVDIYDPYLESTYY